MSFAGGIWLRMGGWDNLTLYFPALIGGLVIFPISAYIFNLYSSEPRTESRLLRHFFLLGASLVAGVVLMAVIGYVNFSTRVGRGVMGLSMGLAAPLIFLHHWLMLGRDRLVRLRVAFVADSAEEIAEYEHLKSILPAAVEVVGCISMESRVGETSKHLLGTLDEIDTLIAAHRLDRIVFSGKRILDPQTQPILLKLRYSGTPCVQIITLCEEYLQYIPLELVSPAWLLQSCDTPDVLYLRKVKRAFDVIIATLLLFILGPALLLGIIVTKLTSPGPAFFRQRRLGRFGKSFEIVKLRTMRLDAEKDGPQWAAGDSDPRLIPGGGWLRKYRIDEIPQLLNVLRGEMSFVGPRPERPEFVATLSEQIPCYKERLFVQPGLTGWAQVRYPYGASVDDARCKLEYDLYYMKHMGLIFDCLILLDTVRVVLLGGLKSGQVKRPSYVCPPEEDSDRVNSLASNEAAASS